MTSLKDLLPAPTDSLTLEPDPQPSTDATTNQAVAVVPAKPSVQAGVSKVLQLPQAANGSLDYSAIVRQGENAQRTMHTAPTALVEKPRSQVLNPLPTAAQISETTANTRSALEKTINSKIAHSKTTNLEKVARKEKPSFIRYTPANTNTAHNSGARQRIIKLIEAPVDPMLPSRFSHRKAPVNPPSPPAPVMHSPERKLSKSEAADWKIPPVVSNWKNNRGYTISLEKRLAADGRANLDHSINDRFAELASALYDAEHTARRDVEKRAQLQRQVSLRAKEAKEHELRQLAERARRERKGYLGLAAGTDTESVAPSEGAPPSEAHRATEQWLRPEGMSSARPVADDEPPAPVVPPSGVAAVPRRSRQSRFGDMPPPRVPAGRRGDVEDEAVRRRDEIRRERREAREREMRRREARGEESTVPTLKRSKLSRDRDRDLAERVALGQGAGAGAGSGELLYDQRLFNQEGGDGKLASGLGVGDGYNIYDGPLFAAAGSAGGRLYRPPREVGEGRVRADKGFGGGVEAGDVGKSGFRDRPVEFEKDTEQKEAGKDPYGLDKFFEEAKGFEGKKG